LPLCGSFGAEDPQCGSGDEVALQIEVDGGVHAEEALGGSSRIEPLLLALSSPHGLMRILRPIILPKRLLMRTGQSETAERRGVGAQFVGDQQFRREAVPLEQLAHQPERRPACRAGADQQIEDLTLVIDRPPQLHPLAGDPHHHFV
jgi:hypothetical protein